MKKTNLFLSALTLAGLLSFAGCGDNTSSSSNVKPSTNSTSTSSTSANSSVSTPVTSTTTSESTTLITSSNAPVAQKHTVTLVLNNGEGTKTRTVAHNKFMTEPMYEKEYFKCVGWYTDETLELEKWNFAVDRVTEDITLYAKWEVDYEDWIWRLGRIASKSTVMIAADHYRKYENGVYSQMFSAGFGSGVIIAKEEDIDGKMYYYALTNNHVVMASNDETNNMITGVFTKLTVYDHYLNPYTAELLVSKNNYDLALLKFSIRADSYTQSPSGGMIEPGTPNWEEQYDIKIAKFADENPEVGANVSSYGSPIAQPHVCTIGTVSLYGGGSIYDNPNSVSNVHAFPVIHHTASILSGNSGGPLYGVDLSLVGINYGSSGSNDTYLTSKDFWAVPISNVRDFLDIYVVDDVEKFNGRYDFLGDL